MEPKTRFNKRTIPPKLGFCPIGKFVFSHEEALRYKGLLVDKLRGWNVDFVGTDEVIKDGVVRSHKDVEAVVDHLKSSNIDALFLPHCNFGTESAAGVIARDLGVPTLLWGPRDDAPLPDGTRARDTLCGLFASSKVMRKLGAKFTYIENCGIDDEAFTDGFDTFMRAANVVKRVKKLRIGQIGQRIDFFWTTIVNESELLERYNIEVLQIDHAGFIDRVKLDAEWHREAILKEIESAKDRISFEGFKDIQPIVNMFAMREVMLNIVEEEGLDAFAVQTFFSICNALGCMVEYATAMVTDMGIPVACETDVHGAISSAMLQAASMDTESILFADLTNRHPENDNAVLLWHCAFPESLKKGVGSIGPHWILPDIQPGSCHWELKDGPITVFRFDGDRGEYSSIGGEGKVIPGPPTQNTYAWLEVNDWPTWERAFIEGPYIHHVAACYGNHSKVMQEACRYIDGLPYQALP